MVLLLHVSTPRTHEQREHQGRFRHGLADIRPTLCAQRCTSHDCSGILAEVHAHVQIILQDMWKERENVCPLNFLPEYRSLFQFYVSFCQLSTWAISNFSVLTTMVLQRDSVTMRESAGSVPILASTSSHGKRKPVHRMESDCYGKEIDGYSGPSR